MRQAIQSGFVDAFSRARWGILETSNTIRVHAFSRARWGILETSNTIRVCGRFQ